MQDEHREAIRRNISSLVNQTDLEIMCSALDEKGIFTEHNMETYRDSSSTQMHRKRCMYNDIMRRGPRAFDVLLETLEENGYWELVRMLDPNSILNTSSANTRLHHPDVKENFISLSSVNKAQRELQNNQSAPHSGGKGAKADTAVPPAHSGGKGAKADTAVPPAARTASHTEIEPLVVTKSVKFVDDNPINHELGVYRTRGAHRGVLFMFTYMRFERDVEEYRAGADVDSARLKHLFHEIGFEVYDYEDLTYQETKKTLESVEAVLTPAPESVFVVVSSHGYERPGSSDNDIRCSDGKLISLLYVVSYFSNLRLPKLRDVPKVFIFSICRGENRDYIRSAPPPHLPQPVRARGAGVATETDGTLRRHPESPPLDKNMALHTNTLVVQATLPGFVSWRDPAKGSWYIQALCATVAERAHDCDVDTLFTLVDERLKENFQIQTSSVDRWGFNRRLYLHPGLFE